VTSIKYQILGVENPLRPHTAQERTDLLRFLMPTHISGAEPPNHPPGKDPPTHSSSSQEEHDQPREVLVYVRRHLSQNQPSGLHL